jgi:DNA-binding transcriptional LysR family regulator
VARKIKDTSAHMYAAPAYLERIGSPATAQDLKAAELFAFDRSDLMIDGLKALGLEVTRRQFPIMTDNHLVQWELCKHGVGICIMMEEIGDAEPRVRRVLPDFPPLPIPIWLVCHRELRTSRRIRLVFDRLASELEQLTSTPAPGERPSLDDRATGG